MQWPTFTQSLPEGGPGELDVVQVEVQDASAMLSVRADGGTGQAAPQLRGARSFTAAVHNISAFTLLSIGSVAEGTYNTTHRWWAGEDDRATAGV